MFSAVVFGRIETLHMYIYLDEIYWIAAFTCDLDVTFPFKCHIVTLLNINVFGDFSNGKYYTETKKFSNTSQIRIFIAEFMAKSVRAQV